MDRYHMSIDVQRLSYIDGVLEKALDSKQVAGGTVSIVQGDREVFRRHFGYADVEKGTKPDDGTIFRMFSMTKPVTAVAALILMERGILDYDDRVSTYLDGFKNTTVLDWNTGKGKPASREVQIRDLLTMTSGLVYPADWSESSKQMARLFDRNTDLIRQGGGMSTVDFCNEMGRVPLVCEPGTTWMYGTSADVLGAVVEVASGKPFGTFLQDEVFAPLGMVDTAFYVPEEKYHRLAQAYYDDGEDRLREVDFMNLCITDYRKPPRFESGGAGLVSTVDDYQRFARMLLGYGTLDGVKVLGRESVELMQTPYLKNGIQNEHAHEGYNYGCLVRILEDRQLAGTNASLGEFGWDGWMGTYFCVDPKEDLVVMYFVQQCGAGFSNVARKVRAITYGAIE